MISYKFAITSKDLNDYTTHINDNTFFNEWRDDWAMHIIVQQLLGSVEGVSYIGNKMVRHKETGDVFSLKQISRGVQVLILSYFNTCAVRADMIGKNLYRYLKFFNWDHDIRLVGDLNLFDIWDESLDQLVMRSVETDQMMYSSEEFNKLFNNWKEKNHPYTIEPMKNRKLPRPLVLNDRMTPEGYELGLNLEHKFNFVDAGSAEGKTLLSRSILSMAGCDEDVIEFWPIKSRGCIQFISSCTAKIKPWVLLVIDITSTFLTAQDLYALDKTADNIVVLILGGSTFRNFITPLNAVHTLRVDHKKRQITLEKMRLKPTGHTGIYDLVVTVMGADVEGITAKRVEKINSYTNILGQIYLLTLFTKERNILVRVRDVDLPFVAEDINRSITAFSSLEVSVQGSDCGEESLAVTTSRF